MESSRSTRHGLVAVRPIGGLCNRLRVISSFQVLARYTGRELRVCWAPSAGFSDEDLSELFDNEFVRIDEAEFDQICENALCLHDAIVDVRGGDRIWRHPATAMQEALDPATRPVIAYRGHHPADRLVRPAAASELPASFAADHLRELRSWRPVESVRRAVDELAATFDASTVGVHVRRGDFPRTGHPFGQSTDAAFFSRMDRQLRDDPGTTFFLSTDSADTEARFRERYGSTIRTNPEKRFVESVIGQVKGNQRDAVIDLFTLARTRHVLGTCYSSFSRTAADLGGASLELALAHPWRYRMRGKVAQAGQRLRARRRAIIRRIASSR